MVNENDVIRDRQKIISLLTAARIEKGISQQALAEMIGTKRSNICRMESGAQNISLDMLLKVTGALGKDVSIKLSDRFSLYKASQYQPPGRTSAGDWKADRPSCAGASLLAEGEKSAGTGG